MYIRGIMMYVQSMNRSYLGIPKLLHFPKANVDNILSEK